MFRITDEFLNGILEEDIPWNDVTTEGMGIAKVPGRIECYPKVKGVVTGIALAKRLFEMQGLRVLFSAEDGQMREAKERVLVAEGSAEAIHSVYKTAQNIMEYASGIAGRAAEMLGEARRMNPGVQVAVTRKNFPGTKTISLYAALSAGAIVHRAGLSESILIFDQHRTFTDDLEASVKRLRVCEPEKKIVMEAGDAEEAMTYVKLGTDVIQLERFAPEAVKALVPEMKRLNPKLIVNVAGGVNASNAAAYAEAGADVLVTSWVYFGKPFDIKMQIERKQDAE